MEPAISEDPEAINSDKSLTDILTDYEAFQKARSENQKTAFLDGAVGMTERITKLQGWMADLKSLDSASLSSDDEITRDVSLLVFENEVFNLERKSYEMPLTSEGGFITSMLYASGLRLENDEQKRDYISKLNSVPTYFRSQINHMNNGLASGNTVPRNVVEKCLIHWRTHQGSTTEQIFFSNPLINWVGKDDDFVNEAHNTIETIVKPALDSLITYMDNVYIPQTRTSIGISEIPQGKSYYQQRVSYFTTLDISPEEVFEIGKKEVARIEGEMLDIMDDLEWEGSLQEFIKFLKTDKQFYAETPEELLHYAAWLTVKAQESLVGLFHTLPRQALTVNPVPPSIAPNYTAGRYVGGSYENHVAGQYWVNTYDLPSRPLYVLPALTLHEAVPGHHLQIALAAEIENAANIRKSTYLSAFGEGWGLYSEFLGKEAGLYTTAYEDFGRLTYEMWRACRLVVDPGMHYKNWSREEAVAFMTKYTALSDLEINSEIDRYIGWPGQAVSYKMGELKIKELRSKAEVELGNNFDIRLFHDAVLENGSITMKSLERQIDFFIDKHR